MKGINTSRRKFTALATVAMLVPAIPVMAAGAAFASGNTATSPAASEAGQKAEDIANTLHSGPAIDQVMPFDEVATQPQNLASAIIGATAYTIGDQPFGAVEDVILTDDFRVAGLKIGSGGMFGFDKTMLAVPLSDLSFVVADGKLKVMTDLAEQDVRDVASD